MEGLPAPAARRAGARPGARRRAGVDDSARTCWASLAGLAGPARLRAVLPSATAGRADALRTRPRPPHRRAPSRALAPVGGARTGGLGRRPRPRRASGPSSVFSTRSRRGVPSPQPARGSADPSRALVRARARGHGCKLPADLPPPARRSGCVRTAGPTTRAGILFRARAGPAPDRSAAIRHGSRSGRAPVDRTDERRATSASALARGPSLTHRPRFATPAGAAARWLGQAGTTRRRAARRGGAPAGATNEEGDLRPLRPRVTANPGRRERGRASLISPSSPYEAGSRRVRGGPSRFARAAAVARASPAAARSPSRYAAMPARWSGGDRTSASGPKRETNA